MFGVFCANIHTSYLQDNNSGYNLNVHKFTQYYLSSSEINDDIFDDLVRPVEMYILF